MKVEIENKHPSKELIMDRLRKTFHNRRKDVLSGKTTKDIIEEFPCFLQAEWVLEEMTLITGIDMLAKLGEFSESKERMKRIRKLVIDNWKKVPDFVRNLIEKEEVCWILALETITREQGFFTTQISYVPYPSIVQLGMTSTTIMVDDQQIGGVESWKQAICVAVSCYWVFNIEIPVAQKKYISILANLVFGIVGVEPPKSVLSIINVI